MKPALIGVVVLAMLALTGCSSRTAASVAATTVPASTPAAAPTAPATASTPASADPLATLDATLAQADGAVNQSQQDASAGDAAAAQNDDH